jgi:hypothetical protein
MPCGALVAPSLMYSQYFGTGNSLMPLHVCNSVLKNNLYGWKLNLI